MTRKMCSFEYIFSNCDIINKVSIMERVTIKKEGKIVVNDFDEACKRLSQFEDFYFDLIENQNKISEQIQWMQENQMTKQYRYRELSANKVTNNLVLRMLKEYGIEE